MNSTNWTQLFEEGKRDPTLGSSWEVRQRALSDPTVLRTGTGRVSRAQLWDPPSSPCLSAVCSVNLRGEKHGFHSSEPISGLSIQCGDWSVL